ncbi:D-allose transporter substrate-binding protein [Bacillus horti]|uniref:D-allose transport system substrate-binding protein n=1 Tax=Caldalkalibacillus horti TaxID=77523 RepID=A0ABT9VZI9_9BACI|nr:D-allose transporter substrate-binding protein [Bacillus horti]MDQ0166232.1 D-allose transport system substrate-binding protein [Bacillus horti]
MKKRSLLSFAVLVLSMLLVVGCGSNATENTEGASEGEDTIKVAMILKTLSNPFWTTMEQGILEEARELGVEVEILASQSEEDSQGQLRIFEDLLNKDYDGIGFAPLSPVNLISAATTATNRGIPLINIDEKVDMDELHKAGGNVNAFVTTDNVEVGEQAANFIVNAIGEGQVAIVEGRAGNASGESRRSGATSVFEGADGIELVSSQPADWDRNKALDVVSNMLQRYPDLRAIYAANDTMALGALQAVQNAGLQDQIIVVGTDGQPEAIESVESGGLTATVAQDSAEIGKESLRLLVEAIKNGEVLDAEQEPGTVTVPSYIVVKP